MVERLFNRFGNVLKVFLRSKQSFRKLAFPKHSIKITLALSLSSELFSRTGLLKLEARVALQCKISQGTTTHLEQYMTLLIFRHIRLRAF